MYNVLVYTHSPLACIYDALTYIDNTCIYMYVYACTIEYTCIVCKRNVMYIMNISCYNIIRTVCTGILTVYSVPPPPPPRNLSLSLSLSLAGCEELPSTVD